MAEQTILVCDVCGAPASTTVSVRVEGKTLHKDLCPDHVGELIDGTRAARPGRRRSPGPAPKATASKARAKRASKAKASKATPRRRRRARSAAGRPTERATP